MSSRARQTPVLLGAYLAHLIIPLFVFLDSVRAIQRGVESSSTNALFAVSGVYLAVNVVAFVLSGDRSRFLSGRAKPLVNEFGLRAQPLPDTHPYTIITSAGGSE